jgi:hypothetical protein
MSAWYWEDQVVNARQPAPGQMDVCLSAWIETSQTMTGILHDMVNRNKR